MRGYVLTTGAAALLLALAHLARILAEGTHLLGQPAFLLATLASIGISNGSIFIRSDTHLYRIGMSTGL